MPGPSLVSALNAALPPAKDGKRPSAHAIDGAPVETIPNAGDALFDRVALRTAVNANSAWGPVEKIVGAVDSAASGDNFGMAKSAYGLVDEFTPTWSRGLLGAGLNALVVGTGSTTIVDRHKALVDGYDEIAKTHDWDFGVVYRLTSLAQQVAVFWRTMANAAYRSATWLLTQALKVRGLARPAAKATELIEHVAATPTGRALHFLNKWIPLLNAAWIMMAAKTAWDVHQDKQASNASAVLANLGVCASAAAVWAGIWGGGVLFVGITAVSILADLLLAETRYRDKTHHDTDALAKRYSEHPLEGAAAAGRWAKRVGVAVASKYQVLKERLIGLVTLTPPAKPAPAPRQPAPAPRQPALDPRRSLT